MKVRNCEIRVFSRPEKTKIVSAKFGRKSTSVFVTADEQNDISLWKNSKEKSLVTLRDNTSPFGSMPKRDVIKRVSLDSCEQEVMAGMLHGGVVIWDIAKQKVSLNFQAHDSEITNISLFDNEEYRSYFATSARNGVTKIWDRRKRGEITSLSYSKAPVTSFAASWDNKIMAVGNELGAISIWDLGNFTKTETIENPLKTIGAVTALSFIADVTYLVAGFSNNSLQLLDLLSFSLCDQCVKLPDIPANILQIKDYNAVLVGGQNFFRAASVGQDNLIETDSLDAKWGSLFDTIIRDTNENSVVSLTNDGDKLCLWMTTYNSINWLKEEGLDSTARFENFNEQTQKDLDKELGNMRVEEKETPAEPEPDLWNSLIQGGFLELNQTKDLMDSENLKITVELEALNEISREHPKMIEILNYRQEIVTAILINIERQPKVGLEQLWNLADPSLIFDTTRALSAYKKLNNFNIDSSSLLLQRMLNLIESRYQVLAAELAELK